MKVIEKIRYCLMRDGTGCGGCSLYDSECFCYTERLREALELLETDEWETVDNPPRRTEIVLVTCNELGRERVRKAIYFGAERQFVEGGFDITRCVTHWRLCPGPAEDRKETE